MKHRELNQKIRNIAIIAHVDHGKTTLVDHMLRQSGLFRQGAEVGERLMDNLELERERGITIAAKNCSVTWHGVKINIVDTPGHADFGGEVERALQMVDGAILLVDASEGPLPQTRFVLRKALDFRLKIILVINKIDRKDARPQQVLNEVYDLLIDLDADEEQLECPVIYAVGREGQASSSLEEMKPDLTELFETIIEEIPAPSYCPTEPFQMLVSNLAYSDFLGRLAIGRIANGSVRKSDSLIGVGAEGEQRPLRTTKLQVYSGLKFDEIEEAAPGEIVILSGIEDVEIGDTICTRGAAKALRRITVDEPILAMRFTINTSPLTGREGRFVQSRKILERLNKETLHNVSLRVEELAAESFLVKGRGEFQMVILLETLRREGYELAVGRPEVILKEQQGAVCEPIEHLTVDCDEQFTGVVTEKLSMRKGRLVHLGSGKSGRVRLEFSIPSRGLIGYRSEFLTDTRGTGIMNSFLSGYEPHRGELKGRLTGSLVADRDGEAVPYALFHLEPRGTLFVQPGDKVYAGMVVGEHNRGNDLWVNPCRMKKLTNVRAAGKDENVILTPVKPMSLESAIEFITGDELVEITPRSIRVRKAVLTQP